MTQTKSSRLPEIQKNIDQITQTFGKKAGDLTAEQHRAIVAYASEHFEKGESEVEVPDVFLPFLNKITQYAYKITDEDVAKLKEAGYSEDAIFELTIGGSLGAGLATWQEGIGAIDAFFDAKQTGQS